MTYKNISQEHLMIVEELLQRTMKTDVVNLVDVVPNTVNELAITVCFDFDDHVWGGQIHFDKKVIDDLLWPPAPEPSTLEMLYQVAPADLRTRIIEEYEAASDETADVIDGYLQEVLRGAKLDPMEQEVKPSIDNRDIGTTRLQVNNRQYVMIDTKDFIEMLIENNPDPSSTEWLVQMVLDAQEAVL